MYGYELMMMRGIWIVVACITMGIIIIAPLVCGWALKKKQALSNHQPFKKLLLALLIVHCLRSLAVLAFFVLSYFYLLPNIG